MINLKIFENWYEEKLSKEKIEKLIKNFNDNSMKLYNNNKNFITFVYLKEASKNRQDVSVFYILLSDSEIQYLENLNYINTKSAMTTCEDDDVPDIIRILTPEKREMLKNKLLFNL